jgi:hypothetical protein
MCELGGSAAFARVLSGFSSSGRAGRAEIADRADRSRFGEAHIFTQDEVKYAFMGRGWQLFSSREGAAA